MYFVPRSKSLLATHWFAFSLNKDRQKSLGQVVRFYSRKKTNEGEMGNPKRRQCSVCLILEQRNEESVIATCIKQFREHLFSTYAKFLEKLIYPTP